MRAKLPHAATALNNSRTDEMYENIESFRLNHEVTLPPFDLQTRRALRRCILCAETCSRSGGRTIKVCVARPGAIPSKCLPAAGLL